MKFSKYIIFAAAALGLGSCSDFLDREPLDFGNETTFYRTENDIRIAANTFYSILPKNSEFYGGIYAEEVTSDNQASRGAQTMFYKGDKMTPNKSQSQWRFENLRSINFFINKTRGNYEAINGTKTKIDHYLGEGYFFRAYEYYRLLRNYGDAPIFTGVLPDDQAVLTECSKRRPRNEVARFIIEQLDSAAMLMLPTAPESGRVCRSAAYALMARVALFEATWEKYHAGTCFVPGNSKWPGAASNPGFKFPSGSAENEVNYFLDQAIRAADAAVEGRQLEPNYASMFNNFETEFASNHEVILARYYKKGVISHSCSAYLKAGANNGVTRAAVNTYLMQNGLPIYAEGSEYQGDRTSHLELTGRDLRLQQSVRGSDLILDEKGNVVFKYLAAINQEGVAQSSTGYELSKWVTTDDQQQQQGQCTTAVPLLRVGECYVTYLEAYYMRHGDLGGNCDKYWVALRKRAGVDTDYRKTIAATDLSKENDLAVWSKGQEVDKTLYSIRRERRCELLAEGQRLDDLRRWRSLDMMVNYQPEGFNLWEYLWTLYDNPNALKSSQSITQSDLGNYLRPLQISSTGKAYQGYTFPKQHYLEPIPVSEFMLTGGIGTSVLYQNPGWPSDHDGTADYNYPCD